MCTIYTYAIPGKPLCMSAIIFTMEPPLSDIHNLYTKQEGQKKGMLRFLSAPGHVTEKHVCIGCKLVACLTGVKRDKGLGEGEKERGIGERVRDACKDFLLFPNS